MFKLWKGFWKSSCNELVI